LYFLTEVEFAVWQVYSVPVTGGTPTRLTKDNRNYLDSAVSPDGSRLAVIFTDRNGNRELDLLSLPFGKPQKIAIMSDGTEATTPSSRVSDHPVWSPDGSEILYTSHNDKGSYDLMAVSWCGGVPRQITQDNLPGMMKKGAAWSPDGKTIAYTSFTPQCVERIYTVPATGGKSKIVGNLNNEILLSPPTWSPDSKKIAYSSFTGFHIIPANGGAMTDLSFGGKIPEYPVWSGNL
jgi:TolB protein